MSFQMGVLAANPVKRALCAAGAFFLILLVYFHYHYTDSFIPTIATTGRWGTANTEIEESIESPKILDEIYNSTLGFEKIFVVGLPSRTDRRDGISLGASLSNMEIEFIDGVKGADVPTNAIPTSKDHGRMSDPLIGSWRAHLNAIGEVVRRNLSSALIMEDDVDWDIRIKSQMRDFAMSARTLTQPLAEDPDTFADPTFPRPKKSSPSSVPDISFNNLPPTVEPTWSPYGDNWDVLWVGHCGQHFPFPNSKVIPKGRVIHKDDVTVPERRYLWTLNIPFTLKEKYPEHTRAVHHAQESVCTLGYAVSLRGARKLLYELALKDVSDPFDILLRFFCEGSKGRKHHLCLTTQPALFHHHRPAGPESAQSDIGDHGKGWKDHSLTDMVQWSVRLNVNDIMDGKKEFKNQYSNSKKKGSKG